ncbi:MAG: HypC/HybG/HupF family hydrogenase formation chaperone [Candidatus Dormibacteraeota bacterium]|nr:HypC/HybG/HupF family hydrogenase formation chaperone [Candidatus Dormibacteraeota bacterium]
MCLAVPGRVLEILDRDSQFASVEVAGVPRKISLAMLEGEDRAGVGDWVLIYTGFAMSKIDEAEARQTQQMLDGQEEAFAEYARATAQIHDEMARQAGN